MPSVSEKQHNAMEAAAHGHSTLGIPKDVGKEFVAADAIEARADSPSATDPLSSDPKNTDHETAELIKAGELPSPQKYGDFWLFDLRITGTGVAYRDSIDEWAVRDPDLWLSPEFVARCNGLLVTFGHPAPGSSLNHEEFQQRAIGTIVLPYIKGEEVWGIAKIFDADAAELMQTTHVSTSPGVVPPQGSQATELKDGTKVLAEGLPLVLDHLAVCERGVWDKAGPPEGIRLDSSPPKGPTVDDLDSLMDSAKMDKAMRDEMRSKLDAMDAADPKDDSKKDESEEEKAAREDATRKDAEEKEAKEAEEKADKSKKDAAKKDEDEETERAAAAEKAKQDAAKLEAITANMDGPKADSAALAKLQSDYDRLQARLSTLEKPLPFEDADKLAKAFHRADATYQMLGERAPQPLPGESSIAYRRRAAAPLRKHSQAYKTAVIQDTLDGSIFDLLENALYDDAHNAAKHLDFGTSGGQLREIKTTENGKQVSRFIGDSTGTVWMSPFMPPVLNVIKFREATTNSR